MNYWEFYDDEEGFAGLTEYHYRLGWINGLGQVLIHREVTLERYLEWCRERLGVEVPIAESMALPGHVYEDLAEQWRMEGAVTRICEPE